MTHDDEYQMVIPGGLHGSNVCLLMDSWDIELACRMIVLGFDEDVDCSIDYGLKQCPPGTTGNDRAHALITVIQRVFTLAQSAIAIGDIKEIDRPANWIAWAKTKGYKTDHLSPQMGIRRLEEAAKDCENQDVLRNYREQITQLSKLSQLIEPRQPAPTADEASAPAGNAPAPAVEMPKPANKVGASTSATGVTTAKIVEAFADLVSINLGKAMTDGAAWTREARITRGTRGGRYKSLWHPVILATALLEKHRAPLTKLNQAFNSHRFLAEWREEWERFSD